MPSGKQLSEQEQRRVKIVYETAGRNASETGRRLLLHRTTVKKYVGSASKTDNR